MNINGNHAETSAWVINYDALDQKVSRTQIHRWVERIASNDPRQHADSIALWLEQGIQELIRIHHEAEPAQFQIGPPQKRENAQPIPSFYEVFTYSSDPKAIQASARTLLESQASMDPLVLLRVLLMRFSAEPPTEMAVNANQDDNSDYSDQQYYVTRRKAAAQSIVRNLSRQLDRLAKTKVSDTISEQTFTIGVRTLFGAITHICLNVMEEGSELKDAEVLTQRFISLLEWLGMAQHAGQMSELKGPLLLSMGAIAGVAERCRDPVLHPQLRKHAKRLIQEDPRRVIADWEHIDREAADRFLTLSRRHDIWHEVEPHVLMLFEIAAGYVKRLIEQRWGFLLKLQEADMHLSSDREDLCTRAKAACSDMQVWACYDAARRAKCLPVIFHTSRNSCSQCYRILPTHLWQRLKKGDAVICDNCHRILLLKG
jgi:hypothetical protein